MSINKKNFIICVLWLALGGLIYLLFREETYVANFVQKFIDLEEPRMIFSIFECDFIKYYFPDQIWAFSLSCGLIALFPVNFKSSVICGTVVFIFGMLWECLQYINLLSGTGDIIDIIMYLMAAMLAVLINIIFLRRKT